MKFLCLHGRGASARVFRSQTASFRLRLDPSIEFDFVDGEYPSEPAPDIAPFYDGPYFEHWLRGTTTAELVFTSHRRLLEKIEQDGPYEGVMLFSQGCSVLASFLMYLQRTKPNEPLPFKMAVFICGGVPLTVLEHFGATVAPEAHEIDRKTSRLLAEATMSPLLMQIGKDRWSANLLEDLLGQTERTEGTDVVYGLDISQVPKDLILKLPTIHVYGSKDPRMPACVQLANVCDPSTRVLYDTCGGHEIPRNKQVSEDIAGLIIKQIELIDSN